MPTSDATAEAIPARGPVVALVDGNTEHSAALWSAVAEAVRSNRTLRLVSSYDAPIPGAQRAHAPIPHQLAVGEALARTRLQAAGEDVRLLHPQLPIVLSLAHTGAVRGLRIAAGDAGATLVIDRPRSASTVRWTRLLGRADLLVCSPAAEVASGPIGVLLTGTERDATTLHRAVERARIARTSVVVTSVRGAGSAMDAAFAALDRAPSVPVEVVDGGRAWRGALDAVASAGAQHVVLPAVRRSRAARLARACSAPVLEFVAR